MCPRGARKGETMKNFRRLFVIDGDVADWSDATITRFVIDYDEFDDRITVKKKGGRDMTMYELYAALGRFLIEYEKETGEKVSVVERRHCYRLCYHDGVSGCRDYYIEEDVEDGFPNRRFILHESMFGRNGGFGGRLGDVLDLLRALEVLKVENGYYVYPEEEIEEPEMKVVKPRYTSREIGWCSPMDTPELVPLVTVRERPIMGMDEPEDFDDSKDFDESDGSEDSEDSSEFFDLDLEDDADEIGE